MPELTGISRTRVRASRIGRLARASDFFRGGGESAIALGRGLQQIGKALEAIQAKREQAEIYHAQLAINEIKTQSILGLDKAVQGADPLAPDIVGPFLQNFDDQVGQIRDRFQTEKGRMLFELSISKLRSTLQIQATRKQVAIAGIGAVQSLQDFQNRTTSALLDNPETLDFDMGQVDRYLAALVANGLPRAKALEIGRGLKSEFAQTAIEGVLRTQGAQAALDLIQSRQLDPFLNRQQEISLLNRIDRAFDEEELEQKRRVAEARRGAAQAQAGFYNDFAKSLTQFIDKEGTLPPVKTIIDAPLSEPQKSKLLTYLNKVYEFAETGKSIGSDRVSNIVKDAILRGVVNSEDQIIDISINPDAGNAVKADQVPHLIEFLQKVRKPGNELRNSMLKRLFGVAKAEIVDQAKDDLGMAVPGAESALARFKFHAEAELERRLKEGEPLSGIMNPNLKGSLYEEIEAFKVQSGSPFGIGVSKEAEDEGPSLKSRVFNAVDSVLFEGNEKENEIIGNLLGAAANSAFFGSQGESDQEESPRAGESPAEFLNRVRRKRLRKKRLEGLDLEPDRSSSRPAQTPVDIGGSEFFPREPRIDVLPEDEPSPILLPGPQLTAPEARSFNRQAGPERLKRTLGPLLNFLGEDIE